MAHNNGMVPKPRKARSAKGVSDNAAKLVLRSAEGGAGGFRAAANAAPAIAADPNIDPAYLAVPVSDLTGTPFVPHRPARPEKSEGGKKFKLVSDYQPAGDQR